MKNKNLLVFSEKRILKMLFLGFSSGLPILLVFSTLSVWLFKAGIDRGSVTLFSWAGFAYAFKYLWAPIVDNFKMDNQLQTVKIKRARSNRPKINGQFTITGKIWVLLLGCIFARAETPPTSSAYISIKSSNPE